MDGSGPWPLAAIGWAGPREHHSAAAWPDTTGGSGQGVRRRHFACREETGARICWRIILRTPFGNRESGRLGPKRLYQIGDSDLVTR